MNEVEAATPTQGKVIEMLGRGYARNIIADTLGITEGYISQLLSEEWFAQEVQVVKLRNMQKHNQLDEKYDTLEEELLGKLAKASKLLIRPMDITKVLQVVNAAKRKGVANTSPATLTQNIVQLNLPAALIQRFITNANNQVVEIQDGQGASRPLVTIASNTLERLSRETREASGERVFESGSASTGDTSYQPSQTIAPKELEQLAAIQTAQKGFRQSLASAQEITPEDL